MTNQLKKLKKEFRKNYAQKYMLYVDDGEYFESDAWIEVEQLIDQAYLAGREEGKKASLKELAEKWLEIYKLPPLKLKHT